MSLSAILARNNIIFVANYLQHLFRPQEAGTPLSLYLSLYISLFLSLSLYIYIYIYLSNTLSLSLSLTKTLSLSLSCPQIQGHWKNPLSRTYRRSYLDSNPRTLTESTVRAFPESSLNYGFLFPKKAHDPSFLKRRKCVVRRFEQGTF
jgi:hypothetical protein